MPDTGGSSGDGGGGGNGGEGSGFGTLPASGPLPPHLLVKQGKGIMNMFASYLLQLFNVTVRVTLTLGFFFSEAESGSVPVPGVTGLGYSGLNQDRGANLQDYYSRREEQDAKAVRL